jgi:hypothetical protein
MPLARILTLHPEDATTLVQQLEAFGFRVETASPNQEQTSFADLEIEFAVCDQQQVIGRAAAIAAQLQAEIVVFPGAIPPLPRPVAPEAVECVAQFQQREEAELVEAEPIMEEAEPGHRFSLSETAWMPSLREKLRIPPPWASSAWHALQQRISAASAATSQRIANYRERRNLRAAQVVIAREERRRERERRRAEAARQALLLQEERRKQAEAAAAAREEELQREQAAREQRLAEMDRLRSESRKRVAPLEPAEPQQPAPQNIEPVVERRPKRSSLPRPSQARGVLTGAIAATVLFFVGILLANFRPSEPFPQDSNNGSIEQQAPFGATTLHGPPGVTLGGSKKAAPAQPRQQTSSQSQSQPAANSRTAKPKSQGRRFQRSPHRTESNDTADDVVVRHFSQPQKTQPEHTQQAGLKHYSDTNQ